VLEGPSVVRTVFIVTDAPQRVSQALLERIGLGVTAWNGRGMFTGQERAILFCSISRPDVNNLKSTISQVDPQAFVVIGQGHQTSGGVIRHSIDREKVPTDDSEKIEITDLETFEAPILDQGSDYHRREQILGR
jgi:hypothetical protein